MVHVHSRVDVFRQAVLRPIKRETLLRPELQHVQTNGQSQKYKNKRKSKRNSRKISLRKNSPAEKDWHLDLPHVPGIVRLPCKKLKSTGSS